MWYLSGIPHMAYISRIYAKSSWSQVLTVGALHQIDSAALRNAASAWNDEFAPLPKPLLVVNIGGPTRMYLNLFTDSIEVLLSVIISN